MRILRILLYLSLTSTCFAQSGNVNLKPLPGMRFVNRTHRLGRGLVGMWLFNDRPLVTGTTCDLSGNGNHGTLMADVYSVPGKFGNGLDFDGTGDYVDAADPGGLGTNYSVSVWAKPASVALDAQVVSKRQDGVPIEFQVNQNNDDVYFAVRDDAGNIGEASKLNVLSVGVWTHIVGVRNGNDISVYVDAIKGTDDPDTFGAISTANILIGSYGPGSSGFFNGSIDNVTIWNRALSAGEIAELNSDPFAMFKQARLPIAVTAAPAGGQVIIIMMSKLSPYLVVIGTISILAGSLGYATRKAA